MDKIAEWIRHYKWMVIGLAYVAIVLSLGGCESTVRGPASGEQVTRYEYSIEVSELLADIDARWEGLAIERTALQKRAVIDDEEFNRQDAIREQILSIATGYITPVAQSYGVSPATTTALITILTMGGFGLANGRKKDNLIAARDAEIAILKDA